ncbi:MAG: class I SAM-dependent methyltransferase [Eudoraea sp.]|nr:class I SAM-dependent methyltransferase [Eudoraea sp.]MBT8222966.1 class I SAM-dependent methyltransferase [Eudoraea sp.]NNJ41191.1 class I SAM-dependent methyltransferase [Eudoraea sp.]
MLSDKAVKRTIRLLLLLALSLLQTQCNSQKSGDETYTYKTGDWNGIGKWYMGREIARVMGYQGMSWLERPEREEEERTSLLLKNMNIQPGDTIADIGAGSGYHVFRMAKLAQDGLIYAVDIQEEMLAEIRRKMEANGVGNIKPVKGSEKSVNLPENSVDKVLIVDVYHEIGFPKELMASLYKAMRSDAKLFLIEYRAEDPLVPIKKIHKMSEAQAVREMKAAGLKLEQNIGNLPWQHCMVFVKE